MIPDPFAAFRHALRRRLDHDGAVSPVIGTMMMTAVTVVLAATVITIVNRSKGNAAANPTNAAWSAIAIDSNGDGATDHIKLTYITGPKGVQNGDVVIAVLNATTASPLNATNPPTGAYVPFNVAHAGPWNPGDALIYTPFGGLRSYTVTISQQGNTILDQSIMTDQ